MLSAVVALLKQKRTFCFRPKSYILMYGKRYLDLRRKLTKRRRIFFLKSLKSLMYAKPDVTLFFFMKKV